MAKIVKHHTLSRKKSDAYKQKNSVLMTFLNIGSVPVWRRVAFHLIDPPQSDTF